MYFEANLMLETYKKLLSKQLIFVSGYVGVRKYSHKLIYIEIQDGRRKCRSWNKWHKHLGYKMKITLMKRFWLFSFDE